MTNRWAASSSSMGKVGCAAGDDLGDVLRLADKGHCDSRKEYKVG
jgi:hypothetical protein